MPRRSPLLRPGQSLSTHVDSRSERQAPRPAALRSAANTTASPSRNDARAPGAPSHPASATCSTTSAQPPSAPPPHRVQPPTTAHAAPLSCLRGRAARDRR
ncbi:hypothetical protein ZWY2020_019264 [Hordeum vulgare]|nr:hypothetical protein ZWY2020_019264 [Hordeum vulgare]